MANIRWNVGPINKEGLKCLEMSIRSFQDLYPNHQYNICYNQIEKSNFKLKLRICLITTFPRGGNLSIDGKFQP